jgi:hypothetical protein
MAKKSKVPFPKDKADESDTPAPPKDRIHGNDQPEDASAESVEKARNLDFDSSIQDALRGKILAYKNRCDNKYGKVDIGELYACYERGLAAYSSAHQPSVSRNAWAMARVRAYLNLRCTGEPTNPKYKQDNDLLPPRHPKSTR